MAWVCGEFPDVPVIIDRPNVPRPEKRPYIAILLVTPIQKVGMNDATTYQEPAEEGDPDTIFNICGQRRFTIAIRAFGTMENKAHFEPQDILTVLQDALEDPNRRAPLTNAGLSVWFSTDILDVTELLETGYEPRAQFDIEMGIASNRTADLGAIEKTKIQGTVDGDEQPEFQVPEEP